MTDTASVLEAIVTAVLARVPSIGFRLATIDPAYDAYATYPTVPLPSVTFDGETTMSTKQYPVLDSYVPVASDRVLMVPVGNTYLIAGSIRGDSEVDRPEAMYQAVGDQSIPTSVDTNVSYSGSIYTSPYVSRAVAGVGHEFTIARAGIWNMNGTVRYAALATGERSAHFHRSGTFQGIQGSPGSSGAPTTLNLSLTRRWSVGDIFSVQAYQNSGGSATLVADNGLAVGRLNLCWLAP